MSSRSRPVSASEMRAGPTSSPASRRMRPNVTTWRTNPPSDGAGGDSPRPLDGRNEGLVANGGEGLVVLPGRAERVLDRPRVEGLPAERSERLGPADRLRDTRRLAADHPPR